jgi:manganese/zinc/iron transport system substrate-binding protein
MHPNRFLNRFLSYIRLLLPPVLAGLLLVSCGQPVATGAGATARDFSGRTINIVATTGMIGDLVQNIGGERVVVTSLMGPGVDPHLYKASAGDVQKLEQADAIFYNGLELEGRMTDIFVKLAAMRPTVAVADDVPADRLREPPEFHGKYDPHIWFDVTLWKYAAQRVEQELSRMDPSSAELYRRNYEAYDRQLDELHAYIQQQIATIPAPSRVLITAHDAFGYFGAQYGMEVRGLQGTSTATEAGAADVQALADFIAERGIKAIFVESSVNSATIEAVQAAVQAKGHDVAIGGQLFSDAMGQAGTSEGTYLGMVRHNVDTIVEALK